MLISKWNRNNIAIYLGYQCLEDSIHNRSKQYNFHRQIFKKNIGKITLQ